MKATGVVRRIDDLGRVVIPKEIRKTLRIKEVVGGYKKIEEGVVGGHKKIEEGAVSGFNKIADKFVDNFLTKDGESIEDAKARLAAEQKAREEASEAEREQRIQKQNAIVEENMKKTRQASQDARRKAGLE